MSNPKILIVEDEGIEALDIQQRLISLGYPTPEYVFSGEDAVSKAGEMCPDLVLMDIMLNGEIDGVTAAEQIHARFDIPVIYLTAYADEDTLKRAKITEPYGYIVKPFRDRELHITIDMALYRHQTEKKREKAEEELRRAYSELEERVAVRTADLALTNKHLKQEIEQRKRAEKWLQEKNIELENAKMAKERFLGSMSHQLRAALSSITGFTDTLLLLPGPLSENQDRHLQTIRRNAQYLPFLINDLLDLAKIESGTVELKAEPVDVAPLIREVMGTLRQMAEQKGLKFIDELPEEQVIVRTDRRALGKILLNLTNSAINLTEMGRVHLEYVQHQMGRDSRTEISVVGTGSSIREEHQKKLVEAFRQLDSTSLSLPEGTGLGLHVSQRLAQLIGGAISLKSVYGKGSAFTLTLES